MVTTEDILNQLQQEQLQKVYQRNMAYANPDWQTQLAKLSPEQEAEFLKWVQLNNVPFDPAQQNADYDMRGFYQALMSGDPNAQSAINPITQSLHYPDYWKTPYHESFSSESQWATEGAPSWKEDKLVSPSGEVIFQDQPNE